MALPESKRADVKLVKHSTLRWKILFKQPDGSPVNLTGSTFQWIIKPTQPDGAAITVLNNADADKRLIVDAAGGSVTLFISKTQIDAFVWSKSEHRLDHTDTLSDTVPRVHGMFEFGQTWAETT